MGRQNESTTKAQQHSNNQLHCCGLQNIMTSAIITEIYSQIMAVCMHMDVICVCSLWKKHNKTCRENKDKLQGL